MKVIVLYLAGAKAALRFVAVLLLSLLVLIGLVLASLPRELFSTNELPPISLALVYGDGKQDDTLIQNLNAEIKDIELVDEIRSCTEDEAEAGLAKEEFDAVILLPGDMLDALVYGGHATITVRSHDPLIGAAVYSIADRAIETLDELQGYALVYEEQSRGYFKSSEERYEAVDAFNFKLLSEALGRMGHVANPSSVSPYYAQVLTLLLFLAVSIASFYVAVMGARHYTSGYVRHLHTRGLRFRHLFASQLLLAVSISLVLGLALAIAFCLVGEGPSIPALLVSSILLSVVLTPLYLMFAGFGRQPEIAVTRALMGCLALMFFLLFSGGGFYPVGLMQFDLRLFNPAWLASHLAAWTLGDPLDMPSLALFVVPLALGVAISRLVWRRSL
jgi:hypothetical protein